MRIDYYNLPQIGNQTETGRAGRSRETARPQAAALDSGTDQQDVASLTSDSEKLRNLAAQAAQTPEVRQDKVAALKSAIDAGTYHPDPSQVASAMLCDSLAKRS